ncbi:hypothetical protein [Marinobacter nauticus]|uniref:hypothetical protein n=1 Tax=Marinobacter nauticus TaxID=2743 RepID=UPI000F2D2675|nr:hypothetical protein [Marinobacter nauticus]RKR79592.1 hypothetical protein C7436_1043 [Marinobacter nauticus]
MSDKKESFERIAADILIAHLSKSGSVNHHKIEYITDAFRSIYEVVSNPGKDEAK